MEMPAWILPVATGVLVTVFAVLLSRQYAQRHKSHQLWWTIGFAMYAAAAWMEAVAIFAGSWSPVLYKV